MALTVSPMRQHQLTMRTKRWAHLWNVVRRDGTKFYWTNHNEEIIYPFGGQTYSPGASVKVSAVRHEAEGSVTTTQLEGAMIADNVTFGDVRAGKWKNARITQRIVNWHTPFFGQVFVTRFWIGETRFDGEKFVFDVHGPGHYLDTEIGRQITRPCKHVFGAAFGAASTVVGCRYDVGADTQFNAIVDTVTDNATFTLTGYTGQADDYYNFGTVNFRTGANKGCPKIVIDDYTSSTDTVELSISAPFTVTSGDRVDIARGCPRDWDACVARSQTDNYYGFRYTPTAGDLLTAPRKKG